jgi:DNA mismatch repair protein MSH6
MTPVDRIFTRVGASDRILSGQSTFFVELAETASILLHATSQSLCILDELGRGTATFDGTAIAHAVTDYLVSKIGCRCMFATHYHSLVDDWEMDARVRLGHMDCIVQTRDNEVSTGSESVTFLYKLCEGSSPRSYGINVGKLARLPDSVVELAIRHSREYEAKMKGEVGSEKASRDFYVQYFDCVVSVAESSDKVFTDEDFLYFVKELWERFQHALKSSA